MFFVFFTLYVFLGLCISCWPTTGENIFFNADNGRAFGDLTSVFYDHYRIKVHPLFLLIAETVTLFVNGLINNPAMSVICVESFCGAISVSIFYSILLHKKVDRYYAIIFSAIYGLSFSTVLFSTIPETFIFAGTGLIAYWYFIVNIVDTKQKLGIMEYSMIIFFGIISFGITLTNYVFYLAGLFYVLWCKYDFKNAISRFLRLNLANGLIITILCKFQQFIWKTAPLFWTSIIDSLHGESYEETLYMDWSVSWGKTIWAIKSSLLRPILAPNVYWEEFENNVHQTLFGGYSNFAKIVLCSFFLLCIVCVAVLVLQAAKNFSLRESGYIFCLLACLVGNLGLHYIYGGGEGFLYSAHYLFLLLQITAIAMSGIRNRKLKCAIKIFVTFFCLVEGMNNIYHFFQTTTLVLIYANAPLSLMHSAKGAILCGGLVVLARFGWMYRNWARKGQSISARNHRQEMDIKATYGDLTLLYRGVFIYVIVACTTGLFIAFNY